MNIGGLESDQGLKNPKTRTRLFFYSVLFISFRLRAIHEGVRLEVLVASTSVGFLC